MRLQRGDEGGGRPRGQEPPERVSPPGPAWDDRAHHRPWPGRRRAAPPAGARRSRRRLRAAGRGGQGAAPYATVERSAGRGPAASRSVLRGLRERAAGRGQGRARLMRGTDEVFVESSALVAW